MSTAKKTLLFLANFNSWRRDEKTIEMPDPVEIGESIDDAIDLLRRYDELERDNAVLRKERQELREIDEAEAAIAADAIKALKSENAALRKELEDVQLWLRNDRRNALARANHMEHLHVQTIDARLRDVNAATAAASRKE